MTGQEYKEYIAQKSVESSWGIWRKSIHGNSFYGFSTVKVIMPMTLE